MTAQTNEDTRLLRTYLASALVILVGLGGYALIWPIRSASSPQRLYAQSAGQAGYTRADRSKILLVQSYHTGYPWVDSITRGVRMALSSSNIDLRIFYMDTKRNPDEQWKRQAGQAAKETVSAWQPDVVIAADDNAQEYFAKGYAGRERPQIVFCGVNAEPNEYGYPAPNVTGVLERPHFVESLNLLNRLIPGAKRIAFVNDDSETSAGAVKWMEKQRTDFEIVSCRAAGTFDQWQEAIRDCQDKADAIGIYMYHTVRQPGMAQSMEPREVMSWTVENSSIPVVGFFIFAVDDGAFCGYLESGVEHGLRAGKIALAMLQGSSAQELRMATALEGQSMLNLSTARRLGIQVPQDVVREIEVLAGE